MRRLSLPLLTLFAVFAFSGAPALANRDEDTWQVGVSASNDKTLVSPDARYCLMPETMPIRPGDFASLQDARGRELGVGTFDDEVARLAERETFQPGEPCRLLAVIDTVAPQEGLRIVIKPETALPISASSVRVNLALVVQSYGAYDWWYDENGYKKCRLLGAAQLGDGSPLVTTPPSLLQSHEYPRTPQFEANVTYSEVYGAESCAVTAFLDFPIADKYVIELGGEMPNAE